MSTYVHAVNTRAFKRRFYSTSFKMKLILLRNKDRRQYSPLHVWRWGPKLTPWLTPRNRWWQLTMKPIETKLENESHCIHAMQHSYRLLTRDPIQNSELNIPQCSRAQSRTQSVVCRWTVQWEGAALVRVQVHPRWTAASARAPTRGRAVPCVLTGPPPDLPTATWPWHQSTQTPPPPSEPSSAAGGGYLPTYTKQPIRYLNNPSLYKLHVSK